MSALPDQNPQITKLRVEYGTMLNWVVGRHTLSFGLSWDYTQLDILDNSANSELIDSRPVEGSVRTGTDSEAFAGNASRRYRADTVGAFVNDSYKVLSNLTATLGLRWDLDEALSEKYGRLNG